MWSCRHLTFCLGRRNCFRHTCGRRNISTKKPESLSYSKPTTVFITCMDSRINPHLFLRMDPGSTFIIRNPGNFIPHVSVLGMAHCHGELAGLQLAVERSRVHNVIICGHSDCRAIQGLRTLKQCCPPPSKRVGPLATWLESCGDKTWYKYLTEQERDGYCSHFDVHNKKFIRHFTKLDSENKLCLNDRISQINVLQQLENMCSHTFFRDILGKRSVQLHAMWLHVESQVLHVFDWNHMDFVGLHPGRAQIHNRV